MDQQLAVPRSTRPWIRPAVVGSCLAIWFAVLCFVPDPRPLSAPESAINAIQSLAGLTDPTSRAVASITLRVLAFGLLGVLVSLAPGGVRIVLPLGILLAPALAVLCQWVNYGHFPVFIQMKISVPSAVVGVLVGLTLRRSWIALAALLVVVGGLYFWGMPGRISEDLDAATRLTLSHVLVHVDEIRHGDDGFADAVRLAFSFAEDNSHRTDPVEANKAAILALGTILGDETVAKVARRELDSGWQDQAEAVRDRVTLRGRIDLPRHFWVSAALLVLTDETRATTAGMLKELMDANPGGSGFSFVDLAANRAGILFALVATRNAESARATQRHIIGDGFVGDDFLPMVEDLPERLTIDQFQTQYGGLGGQRTKELQTIIDRRMETKAVLQGDW